MLIFVLFFYIINNITGTKTYFFTCGAKSKEHCEETMANKDLSPTIRRSLIRLKIGKKAK
jgi:hypothetical protein